MSDSQYDASSIQVLHGLEPVRRRPGMYLGGVDADALHHLLEELLHEAVPGNDPAVEADRIRVTVTDPVVTVEDNSEGIAPARLEAVLSRLYAGGCWMHRRYAPHHTDLAPINAVCDRFDVETWHDGASVAVQFARGVPLGPVRALGPTRRRGTRITFAPDFTILERHPWDRHRIEQMVADLTALTPGLTVILDDEVCRCPDGLSDLVGDLARDPWLVPLRFAESHGGEVEVDAALAWTDRPGVQIRGFANRRRRRGIHVDALRAAVVAAVRALDDRLVRVHAPALFEVVAEGLVAAIHVELDDVRRNQAGELLNLEVHDAVVATVATGLTDALVADHALRDRLLARIPRWA